MTYEDDTQARGTEQKRLEPVNEYAEDLDAELTVLRGRLLAAGTALAQAGAAIEEVLFEHAPRALAEQAKLASAVQRNALAAGAMIAELLHVSGQIAGAAAAVTEARS